MAVKIILLAIFLALMANVVVIYSGIMAIKEHQLCFIAMAPDEYLKENQKLINYRAIEIAKRRCGR